MKPWLIFDLDDTLIPSSTIYRDCYRKLKLGARLDRAKKLAKSRILVGHSSSHNRLIYFKCLEELSGSGTTKKTLALMARYENQLVLQVSKHVRKSGLVSDLKKLKKKYRLALFTNETLRTQLLKISQIDPQGTLFTRVITSEEIGMEKRDPRAYKELFKILRAKPSQCIMVGDDFEQDIQAARRAGIKKTFHVTSKDQDASYKLSTRVPELFL